MEYKKLKDVLHILDLVMSDDSIKHTGKAIRKRLKELPTADVVEVVRCKNCVFAVPLDKHCEINTSAYKHCVLLRGDETRNVWHKYKKYYKDYSIVEFDGFCDEGKTHEQALGKKEGAEE